MKKRLISKKDLAPYLSPGEPAAELRAFMRHQIENWEELRHGLDSLQAVQIKNISICSDTCQVQFNPLRMVSVSADLRPEQIRNRPCFLCQENLPDKQAGLSLSEDYIALCNPYPVLDLHFTISHKDHRPQSVDLALEALPLLAKELSSEFCVFYNGARAGASAPDHMHFQACALSALPVFSSQTAREILLAPGTSSSALTGMVQYLSNYYLLFKTASLSKLKEALAQVLESHAEMQEDSREQVNILTTYNGTEWIAYFVARRKHRPDCFFKAKDEGLLISPACLEMGGVIVAPRREDFESIQSESIQGIFEEVCQGKDYLAEILSKF